MKPSRLWLMVLLPPLAWSFNHVAILWMTHPVCQGASRGWIVQIGIVCFLLAAGAGVFAHRRLQRVARSSAAELDASWRGDFETFLLRLAMGSSPVFALVILLSMVPNALLTPCPV